MNLFRSHISLLLVGLLFLSCTHQQRNHPPINLTTKISNADIEWHGSFVGLLPTISGPSKELISNDDPQITTALISLLSDESRYVAAHVLLTHISKQEFKVTANDWNDLKVEILANNTVVILGGQRRKLIKKWKEWHAGKL